MRHSFLKLKVSKLSCVNGRLTFYLLVGFLEIILSLVNQKSILLSSASNSTSATGGKGSEDLLGYGCHALIGLLQAMFKT
jgi:hypothetical protein